MVEIGGGFKMGVVKYIGETEFAPGEWIGVAFDKPSGECTALCRHPVLCDLLCCLPSPCAM